MTGPIDLTTMLSPKQHLALRRWAVEVALGSLAHDDDAAVKVAASLERYALVGWSALGRGETPGEQGQPFVNSGLPAAGVAEQREQLMVESVGDGLRGLGDTTVGHDDSFIGGATTPMVAEGEASGNAASPEPGASA